MLLAMILSLLLFAISTQRKDRLSLPRRRVQHSSAALSRPYQAHLHSCNLPQTERIEGSYRISLHHGCSLEERMLAINDYPDSNMTITRIVPKAKHHGLYHFAEGIDDAKLQDIRADVSIDMVLCSFSYDGPATDEVDVVLLTEEDLHDMGFALRPYRAPLTGSDDSLVARGSYAVTLNLGYTYEDYKQAIGHQLDLDSAAYFISEADWDVEVRYLVNDMPDAGLEVIRADRRVYEVQCSWPRRDAAGGSDETSVEPDSLGG